VAVDFATRAVLGYIIYWLIQDEMQVNNIAVRADFRGQGIGEAVMRLVLDNAALAGVRSVSLEVRVSNMPARSLYRKLGFEPIGLRKEYYTNPIEDALVLGLNI